MNYYCFHIGDYASRTGHLDHIEDLAYRRMLDLYYTREKPLPVDVAEIARLIRMRQSMAEIAAVLRDFFSESPDGWINARAESEIVEAREHREEKDRKTEHEKERLRRYRERRAEMFDGLRAVGVVPAWDVGIKELQTLFDARCNQPESGQQREQASPETDLQRVQAPPETRTEQVRTTVGHAPATAIPLPLPFPTPTPNIYKEEIPLQTPRTEEPAAVEPEPVVLETIADARISADSGGTGLEGGGHPSPESSQELVTLPKPVKAKREPKVKTDAEKSLGARIFDSYADAYERRYGAAPIRNAKTNGQTAQIGAQLGEDGPAVAAFYVGLADALYVRAMHEPGLLLRDASSLHTRWKTNRTQVTDGALSFRERDKDADRRRWEEFTGAKRHNEHERDRFDGDTFDVAPTSLNLIGD